MLGDKHLKTAAYNQETNGLVNQYSRKIVTKLRQYIIENQNDWDTYM